MHTPPPAELPDDIEQCHGLIKALAEDNRQLHQRIDYLLRRLFGPRSERLDPNQLILFAWGQPETAPAEQRSAPPPAEPPRKRPGHGRKRLPADLPRKRIEHDVAPEHKVCPECGRQKACIGQDVSEQLDYVPASLYVVEHVQLKYACTHCQEYVSVANKPAQPIDRGLAGPGLLAHVITSKYCDHVPLHRQERILARHGVDLSRKTLCGWMLTTADRLRCLVDIMKTAVLESKVIHTDDTPVRVQDHKKNRITRKAYLWPYVGDAAHPYIVFDYTPTRSRDGPERFLREFRGGPNRPRYLQCDAFSGYDGLFGNGHHVLEVGCWAHARRKFFEAKDTDPIRGHEALLRIGKLYEVERDANALSAPERHALRQQRARPLLEDFRTWAGQQRTAVLPKSPIGKAIGYALGNWLALTRYTDDSDLAIDNHPAEQAVRAIALGRKNWLFLGSDRGGQAAGIHFSLIASARRHDLDPFAYLNDVLARIPTHPRRRLHELLPDAWKQVAP